MPDRVPALFEHIMITLLSVACPRMSRLLIAWGLLMSGVIPAKSQELLTDVGAIRELGVNERSLEPAVRVSGLVISILPDSEYFCLFGETNMIVVARSGRLETIAIGDRVRLTGKVTKAGREHVAASRIERLGATAERPEPLSNGELLLTDGQAPYQWVSAEGFVHGLRKSSIGWHLDLLQNGRFFTAVIPRRGQPVTPEFLNARVRVKGISAPLDLLGEGSHKLGIWMDGWIRLERLAPPMPPGPPVLRTIAEVFTDADTIIAPEPVRIRGQVTRLVSGVGILVKDSSGQIEVRTDQRRSVRLGDRVEVAGFATRTGDGLALTVVKLKIFASLASSSPGDSADLGWSELSELIRDVRSIRDLSTRKIALGPPVRFHGIVTLAEADSGAFYIVNRTGAIRVESSVDTNGLARGDHVRISGHAEMGTFGPLVRARSIDRLAQLGLPRPGSVTGTSLLAGRHEAEFVSFDGVVRRIERDEGFIWLTTARADRRFRLRLPRDSSLPSPLIDARIEFNGVVQARVNRDGQFTGCNLLLAGADDLKVVRAAEHQPFKMQVTDIGGFISAGSDIKYTRIKRISGRVVLAWPDRLFVEDATGVIEVLTTEPAAVALGDVVSCVGFPLVTGLKPVLVDAVPRKEGTAPVPEARRVPAHRILTSQVNGRRVRLEAIVTTVVEDADRYSLALSAGGSLFAAELPNSMGGESLQKIRAGSQVAVAGVCDYRAGLNEGPKSFAILLGSVDEVVVLQQPSWFTPERSLMITILSGLVITIALGWVQLLRLRVAATESTLAKSLEASPVAVGIMSMDGEHLLEANAAFVRQFGFTRAEIAQTSISGLGIWPAADERARVLELCREQGSVRGLETQMGSGAGNTLRVLISGESIKWGNARAILLVAQDVTERLELVNQLRESQKMEAVGQLAAGVAHDFNNILTIIQGNSDMIDEEADEGSEIRELNQELSSAAKRASSLVKQLLFFSRKQLMRPRVIDLNDVVEDSLKMIKRLLGAPIEIVTRLSEREANVYADTGMLGQVLMNLAVNSRDAMPDGGRLTVDTQVVKFAPGSRVERGTREGMFVMLRVADTGEGISPETLEHIFEPFFTTKDVGKGTGLGLATVYGIAKQHRGWLEAESDVGRGTAITLFLPLAETEADVAASEEPAVPERMGDETVLIVEDETALRRMVKRTLTRHGYTVHTARDGVAAREKWADLRGKVDLLITDIVMPRGVNGWQLADEFRDQCDRLRIIYTSGYSPEFEKKDKVLERGRNFLPKPFTQHELVGTVRTALDEVGLIT